MGKTVMSLNPEVDPIWVLDESKDVQGAEWLRVTYFGPGQWEPLCLASGVALGVGKTLRHALGGVPMVDRVDLRGTVIHVESGRVFASSAEARAVIRSHAKVVKDNLRNRAKATLVRAREADGEVDTLIELIRQRDGCPATHVEDDN